ncbi:class I SAM-dependent methyltransferase [Aliarcobacter butzleri]|uniref:class I SAM-dependent methyltransferase n=1 Tax=Aliarcobacter butzleri TaxID=28197 RepID=UPI00263C1F64|nr:class I SAM-dependent methyltransferase [Aliarcobacter butzleri]MDN5045703.1 class I SAM-dependent methyltransferase [Aliarcobacter butzleri]
MSIQNIQGLKFPDEYFIKFFFKYKLHTQKNLTYLELGCSNGCNLNLPYQYNNNVIGVDFNSELIKFAKENFINLKQEEEYQFYNDDMRKFCNNNKDINADVLVLPNSIYYIPKNDFIKLLKDIKVNNLIKEEIPFFIRFREIDDFRNHKGTKIEENSYILENGITGEDGAFCKFYTKQEIIDLLEKELNLRDFQTMSIKYENIQNGVKVNNSDVVIWGTIN